MTSNLPVPPLLSLVQPEREPDPEPAGTLAQREPAAPVLAGGRMSAAEQVLDMLRATVTLTLRQAKVMSRREGGLIHGLLAAKPPSVEEQCKYAAERHWVPAGHDGGVAEKAGVIYHVLIGRPGVTVGNAISGVCARPLRFFLALLIITVLLIALAVLA